MNKQCLKCKKDFEAQRESAKFCSDSCRVMWNRKNPSVQEKATELKSQVLFRAVLDDLNEIKGMIKNSSMSIQDLTKPTNQIRAITDPKPTSNVVYSVPFQEKQIMGLFDEFRIELKDARTIPEIETIMKSVKSEPNLSPSDKLKLELYAKDLSKEMYTD